MKLEQCDAYKSNIVTVGETINGFKDIAESKTVGPDGFLKKTSVITSKTYIVLNRLFFYLKLYASKFICNRMDHSTDKQVSQTSFLSSCN